MEKIKFNGSNYGECELFCDGQYDYTVNYPNILQKDGNVVEIEKGDYILKDEEGFLSKERGNA